LTEQRHCSEGPDADEPQAINKYFMATAIAFALLIVAGTLTMINFAFIPSKPLLPNQVMAPTATNEAGPGNSDENELIPNTFNEKELAAYALHSKVGPYFTKIADKNGKKKKLFEFHDHLSIGTLPVYDGVNKTSSIEAQGRCLLPADPQLILTVHKIVGRFPELLKYFQKDDLQGIYFDDVGGKTTAIMPYLVKLTDLNQIHLINTDFANCDLPALDSFDNLHIIRIGTANQLDDALLARCKCLPELRCFGLQSPSEISSVLEIFSHSDKMQRLDLDKVKLAKEDFVLISSIANLRELSLKNIPVTAEDLRQLATLKNLKSMSLEHCFKSDDQHSAALKELKTLQHLNVPAEM